MEPKYLSEEVIGDPNHPLTFGDWIPRDLYDVIFSDNDLGGPSPPKWKGLKIGSMRPFSVSARCWDLRSDSECSMA